MRKRRILEKIPKYDRPTKYKKNKHDISRIKV